MNEQTEDPGLARADLISGAALNITLDFWAHPEWLAEELQLDTARDLIVSMMKACKDQRRDGESAEAWNVRRFFAMRAFLAEAVDTAADAVAERQVDGE